ncbi:unnamed protein product [Amoebophrya sp. A25]|nr:unnamed protein product [Amoebophrya sp. A25]|eukprot:GSA25T00008558001.1
MAPGGRDKKKQLRELAGVPQSGQISSSFGPGMTLVDDNAGSYGSVGNGGSAGGLGGGLGGLFGAGDEGDVSIDVKRKSLEEQKKKEQLLATLTEKTKEVNIGLTIFASHRRVTHDALGAVINIKNPSANPASTKEAVDKVQKLLNETKQLADQSQKAMLELEQLQPKAKSPAEKQMVSRTLMQGSEGFKDGLTELLDLQEDFRELVGEMKTAGGQTGGAQTQKQAATQNQQQLQKLLDDAVAIKALETQVLELNDMVNYCMALTEKQTKLLQNIETAVDETEEYTGAAVVKLEHAEEHQDAYLRKRRIIMCMIGSAVVILIVLIVLLLLPKCGVDVNCGCGAKNNAGGAAPAAGGAAPAGAAPAGAAPAAGSSFLESLYPLRDCPCECDEENANTEHIAEQGSSTSAPSFLDEDEQERQDDVVLTKQASGIAALEIDTNGDVLSNPAEKSGDF